MSRSRLSLSVAISMFCIAVILPFSQSHAEQWKPLRDIISYSDFESLLVYNSARIPELAPIFRADTSRGLRIAGGLGRGFIRWHTRMLQAHSSEELRRMPMPSIFDFQVAGGYDFDFAGPADIDPAVTKMLEDAFGEDLDYIETSLHEQLVTVGGPTIEKLLIGPQGVVDPLGGLRHYWEGRMVFADVPKERFRALPLVRNEDYTKSTEALRFIRFLRAMPETAADAESVEAIRRIAGEEADLLRQPAHRELFEVTVWKLFATFKNDIQAVVDELARFNMLALMVNASFRFQSADSLEKMVASGRLKIGHLTQMDIEHLRYLIHKPSLQDRIKAACEALTQSALEIIKVGP